MNENENIRALDAFGEQLDGAILRRRKWSRGKLAAATGLVVVAVGTPAVAATGVVDLGFDFGGNTPRAGQTGGPPATVAEPDRSINVLEVLGAPNGVRELRSRVSPYGLKVRVHETEVAPQVAGRILGVQFPRIARFAANGDLVLDKDSGGTIIVQIGKPSPDPSATGGLTFAEALPEAQAAIDRNDPDLTLRRLRQAGFVVEVKLIIDNPDRGAQATTGVKTVAKPPPGTVVLAVTGADPDSSPTADTRELVLEVAPAESRVARDHP